MSATFDDKDTCVNYLPRYYIFVPEYNTKDEIMQVRNWGITEFDFTAETDDAVINENIKNFKKLKRVSLVTTLLAPFEMVLNVLFLDKKSRKMRHSELKLHFKFLFKMITPKEFQSGYNKLVSDSMK